MNLAQLKTYLKKIEKYITFDESNILQKTSNFPILTHKLINLLTDEIKNLKDLELQKKVKYGKLYKYYKTEDDYNWSNKLEIDSQIYSHKDYVKVCQDLNEEELVVKRLEETLDNVKKISFHIRNFIEWKKFTEGDK